MNGCQRCTNKEDHTVAKDNANGKIYYETFHEAVERNRPRIPEVKK